MSGGALRRKVAVATWRAPREGRLHARLEIEATGANTTTDASVGFNGFDPLRAYCI